MKGLLFAFSCCLILSACTQPKQQDSIALTTQTAYYMLDKYSENYSIRFTNNKTHFYGLMRSLPSVISFKPIFEQYIERDRIRDSFDNIYKVYKPEQAEDYLFMEFGLLDYYYDETKTVKLSLNIRLSLRDNLVFERSYHGQGISQNAAEFLQAPVYGRENIVLQATENALDDVFAHFKNDFMRAKRHLGFPFRYSGGWYKKPAQ